ncbi:MAG: hypothetical protein DCC59_13690 [Chloroflexi bacterium]|nr:hypothetical protein [Chloroflexi bacterium CFX1]MCK6568125.1 hypothetical protein [Anaerolineales bacterium]MCQ3954462.1 hypothetical protein [Chloroflexota bacterium]NUQ60675.1 hypothetical protein [Anaerolineales bacterium]RIK50189.1 MAG: hypothetical protein DCC59_13690 [Chloroflexota bacterium]
MAEIKKDVVERNIRLTGEIIKYILNNPEMTEVLPENFELVLLPEDDPEVRMLNLDLLDKYGSEGKPIVFARVNTHMLTSHWKPSIFIPVAV